MGLEEGHIKCMGLEGRHIKCMGLEGGHIKCMGLEGGHIKKKFTQNRKVHDCNCKQNLKNFKNETKFFRI